MGKIQLKILLLLVGLTGAWVKSAAGPYWVPTGAPITNWNAVACSSNGNTIVAASLSQWTNGTIPGPGPLFVSKDCGANWSATTAPITNWAAVTCSADGTRMAAAAGFYFHDFVLFSGSGPIFASSDSGLTWRQTSAPIASWMALASSADGTRLAGGLGNPVNGSTVWTSTNSGASWTPSPTPFGGCTSVAMSADGTKLAVAVDQANIYTSSDFGVTWNSSNPGSGWWSGIACSADGRKLAVAPGYNGSYSSIYVSSDFGTTWTPSHSPLAVSLFITASGDGTKMATIYGGHLFLSTDGGTNWNDSVNPLAYWGSIACSADGTKLFAVPNDNGSIYTCQVAPRLDFACSGSNVELSWPAYQTGLGLIPPSDPATNFVVQYSFDAAGTNWTSLTLLPTVTNLTDRLIVPRSPSNIFYRLKGS